MAATLANVHRDPERDAFSAGDFMPRWDRRELEAEERDRAAAAAERFKAFLEAHAVKVEAAAEPGGAERAESPTRDDREGGR